MEELSLGIYLTNIMNSRAGSHQESAEVWYDVELQQCAAQVVGVAC